VGNSVFNYKLVLDVAFKAGEEIMKIYNSDYEISLKEDDSPLTLADKRSHEVIIEGLRKFSDFPILSEEGSSISYEERKNWGSFWLIDPLDGTKEFIKRNGEFTVNIALVRENRPVFGVVYAPAKNVLYYGGTNFGAFRISSGKEEAIGGSSPNNLTVVTSKSHMNDETRAFIDRLKEITGNKEIKTVAVGSSLKICLVAEGKATLYPRLGPTMEWDTAAAHAVLRGAGGKLISYSSSDRFNTLKELCSKEELRYNKKNLLNPFFIALSPDVC